MAAKRKPGRPRKSAEEKRKAISVYVTRPELRAIVAHATATESTPSQCLVRAFFAREATS
jgi:hypothetical protein